MRERERNMLLLDEWRRLPLKHLVGCSLESAFSYINERKLPIQFAFWEDDCLCNIDRCWLKGPEEAAPLSCIYQGHQALSILTKANLETDWFGKSISLTHLSIISYSWGTTGLKGNRVPISSFYFHLFPLHPKLLLHSIKAVWLLISK